MNLELPADSQERLGAAFWKLDHDTADETFKMTEAFKAAGQAGNQCEFVLSHRKRFPFSVQPETGDLRELVLLHTKKWLLSKMDLIAAEWTKLGLDEQAFRSQMDRVEWILLEEAAFKFAGFCSSADDWNPADNLLRYAEKELRLALVVRGRGWCRRNQARALLMSSHLGMPRKLEQDTATFGAALREAKFGPTWASTRRVVTDPPACDSTTDIPDPRHQASSKSGEAEAADPETSAKAHAQSQTSERTDDNTGRHGARAEAAFPVRAGWLKDRLRERAWNYSDPYRQRGPDRKTVQKILRGEGVREDILEKLANALSTKGGKVDVLDIPQT